MNTIHLIAKAGEPSSAFLLAGSFASSLAFPVIYLVLINLFTAVLFQRDKRQSETGGWRIPENTLLGLAVLGGSAGAKWAQYKYRHKTRKQPFALILNTILIAQTVLVVSLIFPPTRALLLS